MINVLYVFGGEQASGAEMVIDRLITANVANVNPHIFIAPGSFATNLKNNASYINVVELSCLKKLNRISNNLYIGKAIRNYFLISVKVIKYCRKHNIEVVHGNTLTPSTYLLLAVFYNKLFRYKIKWIWSDHDVSYFSKLDIFFSKICSNCFDLTLAVSRATARKHGESKKIKILYNGLNTAQYKIFDIKRTKFRQKFELENNVVVFGIAAAIKLGKGQLILVEEFLKIAKQYPNVALLIAGGESNEIEYVEMVKVISQTSLGKIKLLGKVTDMIEFYNGIDCLISNSDEMSSEALGTTIYEAMACGKLVIASNVGGSNEIIDDSVDGILFEPNRKSLNHTLERVCLNYHSLSNLLTPLAIDKVANKFNIDIIVAEYNNVLAEFINPTD